MGKNKKKDKSKKKTLNITFVEDAFYRLSVADCEKKIERLQKNLENIEISNVEIQGQINTLTYEQVDKAADLTKNLRSLDESIYKYNEEIHVLSQEFAGTKSRGDATIADLEDKYKAMHDQLTCEIKLLKAKLHMLEDFRLTENKLNFVIENEKHLLEEKQQEYKNVIAKMKFKIQAEKEAMQKEIETKLVRVSEEFTRSSAIRDAAYAQRLIRENIALEKEIDVLKSSQQAMDQQLKEHTARCKEIKETFSAIYRQKRELIFVAQQKTNLIDRITTKYEKLKTAYTDSLLYKNQYQDLVQYQMCKHFQQHQMVTQAKKLASRAHLLKSECRYLDHKYVCSEKEIARLRDVILLIRRTILDAVSILETPQQTTLETKLKSFDKFYFDSSSLKNSTEEIKCEQKTKQKMGIVEAMDSKTQESNLLEDLLDILERLKVEATPSTSIDTVTPNSFLLKYSDLVADSSDSMRESFKHSRIVKRSTIVGYPEEVQLFKQGSKGLIPKERMERCILFDVEKGSSFYASSSKTATVVEEHDGDDLRDQESSSYDSLSSENVENKQASPSKQVVSMDDKDLKQIDFPPGSIIDVEMAEEEDLNVSENENYSISNEEEIDIRESGEFEDEMSVYMFY